MQKYKGQSLAIVLVLLLVGSIIGFSLYARNIRDAERSVGEKAASEANELTETIIGLISTSEYENIKRGFMDFVGGDCDEMKLGDDTGCRKSSIGLQTLREDFFNTHLGMSLSDNAFEAFERVEDYCKVELAMRYASDDEDLTIEQDDAFSLFFNKVEDWTNCKAEFIMTNNGADGFVLSTFYGQHDFTEYKKITSLKDYEHKDIKGYRYGSGGGNWEPYASGSDPIEFNKNKDNHMKSGYSLHEVRFKSLGGSSNLSWTITEACEIENYLLMEVGATCGDKYVGKKFFVPAELFAPPVFDYVLFNGQGTIIPEKID